MAKTTADTTLVRGAATAYKNYDNDPAIYSGLDKVIKIANLAPESSMTRGDLLFAMVKTSTAATAFFKLGIEVGYDN